MHANTYICFKKIMFSSAISPQIHICNRVYCHNSFRLWHLNVQITSVTVQSPAPFLCAKWNFNYVSRVWIYIMNRKISPMNKWRPIIQSQQVLCLVEYPKLLLHSEDSFSIYHGFITRTVSCSPGIATELFCDAFSMRNWDAWNHVLHHCWTVFDEMWHSDKCHVQPRQLVMTSKEIIDFFQGVFAGYSKKKKLILWPWWCNSHSTRFFISIAHATRIRIRQRFDCAIYSQSWGFLITPCKLPWVELE